MGALSMILAWSFVIVLLISFVVILVKGLNNDLVIYQNKNDFYRVIFTIISCGLALFLVNKTSSQDQFDEAIINWLFLPASIIASAVLLIDNFILCIKNNEGKIFIGFVIAIYRYFYIILAMMIIVCALKSGNQQKRGFGRLLIDLTIAGTAAYTTYLLINGDAVRIKRSQ